MTIMSIGLSVLPEAAYLSPNLITELHGPSTLLTKRRLFHCELRNVLFIGQFSLLSTTPSFSSLDRQELLQKDADFRQNVCARFASSKIVLTNSFSPDL